jgi:hypothetical protein
MKHLLNDLTEQEKNSIREQHTGGMKVVTENFSKLINAKSGNVKPLVNEIEGLDTDDYADDTDSITIPIMRMLKPIYEKYGSEGVVDFLTDIIRDIDDVGDELFMGPDDYLREQEEGENMIRIPKDYRGVRSEIGKVSTPEDIIDTYNDIVEEGTPLVSYSDGAFYNEDDEEIPVDVVLDELNYAITGGEDEEDMDEFM